MLYLLRHGETKLNKPGEERLRGWLDVPLDKTGYEDAEKAAKQLRSLRIRHIFTSDLQRARRTADIVHEQLGVNKVDFSKTKLLRPWNVGFMSGQRLDRIRPQLQDYIENPTKKVPDGESYQKFVKRFGGVFRQIAALPGNNLIVTSHSNLLAVDPMLNGKSFFNATEGPPAPGQIMCVDGHNVTFLEKK